MKSSLALIALVLAVSGCSTAPQSPDPYCSLWVERTVTYGGQTFKKPECIAWQFGPTKRELLEWDRRHGAGRKQ